MLQSARAPVWLSYATFVLVGVSAGVSGVLRPSQMAGYGGVDRSAIGLTFFTGAAGFAVTGYGTGGPESALNVYLAGRPCPTRWPATRSAGTGSG